MSFRIGGRDVGGEAPVLVVAELSCSHAGRKDTALRLIEAAKQCGADAVKFQLFRPHELTLDVDAPHFRLTTGPWKGMRLWDLYEQAMTPWEWFPDMIATAKANTLEWFTMVGGRESIDYAESLDCPAYKIASADVVDTRLLTMAFQTGKPVIASGLPTSGREPHGVLVCSPQYPAPWDSLQLATVTDMLRDVPYWAPVVGFSDHTRSPLAPAVAVGAGAKIIERHLGFEEDRADSLDGGFYSSPNEFTQAVWNVRAAEEMLGAPDADPPSPPEFQRRPVHLTDPETDEPVTLMVRRREYEGAATAG